MSETVADVATAVAIGCRERQEDVVATQFADGAETGLAVLSDGMGGHDDGDLAARVIVSALSDAVTGCGDIAALDQGNLRGRLLEGVHAANQSLRHSVDDGAGKEGMGGTVVAAVMRNMTLSWISVGDSALYLFRDSTLRRLNEDHSLGPQIDLLAERGMMDPEIARSHPQRGCLTSALVGGEIRSIDCPADPLVLTQGDIILIASDGLAAVERGHIIRILDAHCEGPSDTIAQALMDAVTKRDDPDQDNASVIVIKPLLPGTAQEGLIRFAVPRPSVTTRILARVARIRAIFAAASTDRVTR